MDQVQEQFLAYLRYKMPQAADIAITSLSRLQGGNSRETYRAQVEWKEADKLCERSMVIRREAVGGHIETKSEVEYRAYEAFFRVGIPVPEPLFIELSSNWLTRPFIVMSEIIDSAPGNPFHPNPYGALADKVGEQFYRILGTIAAQDPARIGLLNVFENVGPEDAWRRQLDYWAGVIENDSTAPAPVLQAAIRWLRRNPPPPAQKISVVHGDYRSGNFMLNPQGEIKAILDWEMAHLGDPLEDLGYALDPYTRTDDRPGGMISRQEGIRIWEQAGGLKADPVALRWWELFNHVKIMAIIVSASKEFFAGNNDQPMFGMASWLLALVHSRNVMKTLVEAYQEKRL